LLSEEEWSCISDVHGILQVSFICNMYVYMHLYTVYVNIYIYFLYSISKKVLI